MPDKKLASQGTNVNLTIGENFAEISITDGQAPFRLRWTGDTPITAKEVGHAVGVMYNSWRIQEHYLKENNDA